MPQLESRDETERFRYVALRATHVVSRSVMPKIVFARTPCLYISHDETETCTERQAFISQASSGVERACEPCLCTVACGGHRDGCVGKEQSDDSRDSALPRPFTTAVRTIEIVYGTVAASIVAASHDAACQQGAICDRQTMAACDQNETQCYLPISFYTDCHRILWHG